MSTFRQDPVDRDSARVAGDLRTLRQRIAVAVGERRPAVRVESLDRPSHAAPRSSILPAAPIEDAPELVDDRELVSH